MRHLQPRWEPRLRGLAYLTAGRAVPFQLQEIWDIVPGTFRVRCAAVIGVKRQVPEDVVESAITGVILSDEQRELAPFSKRRLGQPILLSDFERR